MIPANPPELTAELIRARFPNPIPYDDRDYAIENGKPCYCVGGALLMSCDHEGSDESAFLDEDFDDVDPFPYQFDYMLEALNRKLSALPALPAFATGYSMSAAAYYEFAIRGANDAPPGGDQTLTLAWQLLDDALTFDPDTFDHARRLRLVRGLVQFHTVDGPCQNATPEDVERLKKRDADWLAYLHALEAVGG